MAIKVAGELGFGGCVEFAESLNASSISSKSLVRAELEALRGSVYTMGGSEKSSRHELPLSTAEVVKYAKAFQDAGGRVRKSQLIEHFTSDGHLPGSVNQALDLAKESGALSVNEMWVIIQ